jgi:hypothetical protein
MLSGKLVHLIESHWEEIVSSVITQLRREPMAEHYRAVVEPELREWGRLLLENLGHWLTSGKEDEIAAKYEQLGKLRFEAGIPAHESVHVLFKVRERVLDFVEEHIYSKTTIELYQQEEFDRRVARFFDFLTVHMVKGYETALRRALTTPAAAAGWRGGHG